MTPVNGTALGMLQYSPPRSQVPSRKTDTFPYGKKQSLPEAFVPWQGQPLGLSSPIEVIGR